MKFAQTQILGRLRHQTFFSLEEANDAIELALERMNNHIMRGLDVSCGDLFASIEWPALSALPAAWYEYAEWCLARVSIDYRVEVDHFLCSVPHTLLREQVDVPVTSRIVEIFRQSKTGRCSSAPLCWSRRRHPPGPHAELPSVPR